MIRDWNNIDKYYDELLGDVYPQPMDEIHYKDMVYGLEKLHSLVKDAHTVLDVGCGQGDAQKIFRVMGYEYAGISLGRDVEIGQRNGYDVFYGDFHFLDFRENSFDLVFSRHSLEHSPMPLLALMEWHRVSNKYLYLIVPNPDSYLSFGRNHYSIMDSVQLRWLLRRAGWKVLIKEYRETELIYLCDKQPRISCEGWAKSPLSREIFIDESEEEEK